MNKENYTEQNEQAAKDYELLQETKKLRTAKSTLYVPKKDKYEDLNSSAIIFCIFGIVGDLVLILSMLDIISLPFVLSTFSQSTMFLMFTLFLCMGISSGTKASKIKAQISQEETDTDTINQWLTENITPDKLQQLEDSSVVDEINYLNKLNYIKEQVLEHFPEMDDNYVDLLADEYLNKLS